MIEAIIFDLDGVIADTQQYHAQIESEILNRFGVVVGPEEITKKYAGIRTEDFLKQLLADKQIDFDIKKIMAEKWQRINEICRTKLVEVPGSSFLIKTAYNSNLKLAVASASSADFVRMVLRKLKIIKYFSVVVSADEVGSGKPNPDVFLLAAGKLLVSSQNCVVIEDSLNGMMAAKAAGMKCIGLTADKQAPANLIISSFAELDINKIKSL